MKHRLTFTTRELEILRERLEVVRPFDYDLDTYSKLRHLYGRIDHILLHLRSNSVKE